jgi:tetratricopeptide (TPR) repeat protein
MTLPRGLTVALMALLLAAGAAGGAAADSTLRAARDALAAGRYDDALERARALTRAEPPGPEARRILARALLETGRHRQALAEYRRLADAAGGPDLPAAVAAADLERLLGDSDAAEARLRGVIDAASGRERQLSATDLIAVGDAYRRLAATEPELYQLALERYEAAIERAPEAPAAHVAMGELLLDRYNNTEALEAFRTALEHDRDDLRALLGLARSQRFDHSPATEQTLRVILDRQPTLVPARVLLARLLIDSESYAAAERELRAALAVNARSPQALTALAALRYLRGEPERFDALVAQVRQIAPGYSELYETLAEIAGQNRRYGDALRFAMRQVALDPQAWRGHTLIGVNRLRLGQMQAGRSSLERAFRGDPYDVRTSNTLELLERLETFRSVRSRHFVLVAAGGEAEVLAPRLLPIAEQAYAFFAERYGRRIDTPIRIEVYPNHEDFSVRTVGLVGIDIIGVSFGPVIALDSPSAGAAGRFNWASAVWHEIAHSFHLAVTDARVPRWFTEGLAVYEERRARPGWGMDVSPGFLDAFRRGLLAPASDMNRAFLRPTYPNQIPHAYYQASLVMELIEQRRGFDAILDLLRGYAAGRSTGELLTEVLDMPPAELDTAFEAFVRERFQHSLDGLFADGGGPTYPELMKRGQTAMEAGDLATAQALLEQALTMFPDHAGPGSAYRLLATVHQRRGEPAAAIDLLRRSVAIDADDLQGHRELARLYRSTDQPGRATRTLERALLIQPFDPEIHARLAEIHEAGGDWREAVGARAAVVALEPADPVAARYRLALAMSRAGDPLEARRELLRTLENAPLYEDALELLLVVREQIAASGHETDTRRE